jgi:probable phosphoglycerate mutase
MTNNNPNNNNTFLFNENDFDNNIVKGSTPEDNIENVITVKIILVRHGETEYNLIHRLQGHLDTKLTDTGHQQAQRVAKRLGIKEQPTSIYSSDLSRAKHTAEYIAKEMKIDQPITTDIRLREMNLGIFQNHTSTEARQKFPDIWKQYQKNDEFIIPQGESLIQFYSRCNEAFIDIAEKHFNMLLEDNDNKEMTICIVTHGGVIDAIGKSWSNNKDDDDTNIKITHCDNTGVCEMVFNGQSFNITSWNDTSHLTELSSTAATTTITTTTTTSTKKNNTVADVI